MNNLFKGLTALGLCCAAPVALAQNIDAPHPGASVYEENCAACHNFSEQTRAPDMATLNLFSQDHIREALTSGIMAAQGAMLTAEDMTAVVEYLGQESTTEVSWTDAMSCPADRAVPALATEPLVSHFGFDLHNSRQLSLEETGLAGADLTNLELAWAVGFPGAVSMREQAAIVGDTMFLPVGESESRLFAFDISEEEPCIQWIYHAEQMLRSSTHFGTLPDGTPAVIVGDRRGGVHAVNAVSGEQIWTGSAGLFERSMITGTPALAGDRVIVPSSQAEIMQGANNAHLCCTTHGGVVALDAMTGERVWEMHTMPHAEPVRDRGDGQMLLGPSGAPIWNSPSIDLERGQLYVGTGEATSPPAHVNTDALIAIDLETGDVNWSFQATANDIFLVGCRSEEQLNCVPHTETVYRDVDFGASTILATTPSGRDLVLAGQKSGTVWALDPDTGEVVWRTDIGTGGPSGGIHWGIAADETHVYAPISHPGRDLPDYEVPDFVKPGLYAVNLETGEIDWAFQVEATCPEEQRVFTPRCQANFGLSGAPTVLGDYVLTGGLDGWLYMLNRQTGELVWQYQTARDFDTLNGVEAHGGAIDNASIVAANGMVFMNSGYGLFGAGAGNVMLAFKPVAN